MIELCIECDEVNGWKRIDFYEDGSNMCVCSKGEGNCWSEDPELM